MESAPNEKIIIDEATNEKLLEIGIINFQNTFLRKENLENKANYVLVASGVLLGLLSINPPENNPIFALIAIIFLIGTSLCSIICLQTQPYAQLGMMDTWKALHRENVKVSNQGVQESIMASLEAVIKKNNENIENLATWYRRAYGLFIVSILFVAGIIIINYLKIGL